MWSNPFGQSSVRTPRIDLNRGYLGGYVGSVPGTPIGINIRLVAVPGQRCRPPFSDPIGF